MTIGIANMNSEPSSSESPNSEASSSDATSSPENSSLENVDALTALLNRSGRAFGLELSSSKPPIGQAVATHIIGETVQFSLTASENSFVYLFSIRSTGTIAQLLPNTIDTHNSVSAGQSKFFPHQGAGYSFSVEGPTGINKLVAVASKMPLDTTQIMSFASPESVFLTTNDSENEFIAKLTQLLNTIAPQLWAGDSKSFYVAQPSWLAPDKTGTLFLKGNVGYASVFINDELVGALEPITGHFRLEELAVGEHDLKVSADNHANYISTFFINPDLTTELDIFQQPDR